MRQIGQTNQTRQTGGKSRVKSTIERYGRESRAVHLGATTHHDRHLPLTSCFFRIISRGKRGKHSTRTHSAPAPSPPNIDMPYSTHAIPPPSPPPPQDTQVLHAPKPPGKRTQRSSNTNIFFSIRAHPKNFFCSLLVTHKEGGEGGEGGILLLLLLCQFRATVSFLN